jgi:hypothetical protein
MTRVPADAIVQRLRQSLYKLLGWAERYQPQMLHERTEYDADLDEAEDLLDATEVGMVVNADQQTDSAQDGTAGPMPDTDT